MSTEEQEEEDGETGLDLTENSADESGPKNCSLKKDCGSIRSLDTEDCNSRAQNVLYCNCNLGLKKCVSLPSSVFQIVFSNSAMVIGRTLVTNSVQVPNDRSLAQWKIGGKIWILWF